MMLLSQHQIFAFLPSGLRGREAWLGWGGGEEPCGVVGCVCFPTASETLALNGFTNLAITALAFKGENKTSSEAKQKCISDSYHVKLP